MVAGMNGKNPELYTSDITGNYFSYRANAIGENDDKIKEALREKYNEDIEIKKGVKLVLDIFKEVQGSKFDLSRFELSYIGKDELKIKRLEDSELKNFVK
jgi:20S proteasome alpha/beta subunit